MRSSVSRSAGTWGADDADALRRRIVSEYHEMPGLVLTVAQAARLWHEDVPRCEAVLEALVGDGYLRRTRAGAYVALQ